MSDMNDTNINENVTASVITTDYSRLIKDETESEPVKAAYDQAPAAETTEPAGAACEQTPETEAAPVRAAYEQAPETEAAPVRAAYEQAPVQEQKAVCAGYSGRENEYNYDPYTGMPVSQQFTYGSGAPGAGNPGINYVSSYGTVYRRNGNAPMQPRKRMPNWLKVGLSAVAFGLLAAFIFFGTNTLLDHVFPSGSYSADSPAVNEDSATNRQHTGDNGTGITADADAGTDSGSNDSNGATITGSPVKKDASSEDTVVSSTDTVDSSEVSYTDVSAVVENSMPAIVQINCTFNTQSFFGTYQSSGAGSGIIIKQNGDELLIATNNHVVENAITIEVTFDDDTKASAYIKGTDAYADLAVVAVSLKDLDKSTISKIKIATLGDSDSVKVGQMAIAIGNALGYGTSTTVGYISAINREVEVDGRTMTLIQTDAAINPGNSGGALLNIKGEVIGINSVKYASSDVEGMGFAIPISRAVDILENLANRVVLSDEEKGYLGIQMKTVTSEFAAAYNWPTGIYVSAVIENSPAEESGILSGDIITAINGINVQTSTDLANEIASYKAGTTVTITLQRLSRGRFSENTISVTLGARADFERN